MGTIALALATLILAIATLRTARGTKELAEETRDLTRSTEKEVAAVVQQATAATEQVDLSRAAMQATIRPIIVALAPSDHADDKVFVAEGGDFISVRLPFRNAGS